MTFRSLWEPPLCDFSGGGKGACFLGMSPKHHTSGQYLKASVHLQSRPCITQPLFATETTC